MTLTSLASSTGKHTVDALEQIRTQGYAMVRLESTEAELLEALHKASTVFFDLETSAKLRYGVPNRATGYRPHAYAHAGDPDRPDLNDSFLFWGKQRKLPQHHEEITEFLDALEGYRLVARRITVDLLDSLAEHYTYRHELPFDEASFLQVNSYGRLTDEELLQQPHEDATFLTVIWTSSAGLEGVQGDEIQPFTFERDEVMIMPSSLLTAMTGGQLEPYFHQARNHRRLGRKSIMFFVSPDPAERIEPYLRNEKNQGVDIARLVLDNPQSHFGLSGDFITS